MYLAFYGLAEKPFNTTPDPKFLWLTPGHREALAQLLYSVQEKRGFLVLTGEVGTGKTTLLNALLRRLDANTATAFVSDSTLPFDDLLAYAFKELGVSADGASRADRLFALKQFLIERQRAGRRTALIIDEAQNLDVPTLEQIRLLSNIETPEDKLLQILLVGQPELRVKLKRPELRQLQQRIELHCTIPSLSSVQTRQYVQARVRIAGGRDRALFSDQAIATIAAYTVGIPRRINILCDHCLVLGYAGQERRIERDVVRQAIASLEGPQRLEGPAGGPLRRVQAALGAIVAAPITGVVRVVQKIRTARALFVQ
jgi:general secretion pathway protein A